MLVWCAQGGNDWSRPKTVKTPNEFCSFSSIFSAVYLRVCIYVLDTCGYMTKIVTNALAPSPLHTEELDVECLADYLSVEDLDEVEGHLLECEGERSSSSGNYSRTKLPCLIPATTRSSSTQ